MRPVDVKVEAESEMMRTRSGQDIKYLVFEGQVQICRLVQEWKEMLGQVGSGA